MAFNTTMTFASGAVGGVTGAHKKPSPFEVLSATFGEQNNNTIGSAGGGAGAGKATRQALEIKPTAMRKFDFIASPSRMNCIM